jgi:hypothetical protein
MSQCSFLSTAENEIECFGDCAFYNWEETGGVCPFKNLTGNKANKYKDYMQFDFFNENSINLKEIDEYYIEKDFI